MGHFLTLDILSTTRRQIVTFQLDQPKYMIVGVENSPKDLPEKSYKTHSCGLNLGSTLGQANISKFLFSPLNCLHERLQIYIFCASGLSPLCVQLIRPFQNNVTFIVPVSHRGVSWSTQSEQQLFAVSSLFCRVSYAKAQTDWTPILRIGDQVLTFDVFWPKHLHEVRSTVYIHVQSIKQM